MSRLACCAQLVVGGLEAGEGILEMVSGRRLRGVLSQDFGCWIEERGQMIAFGLLLKRRKIPFVAI